MQIKPIPAFILPSIQCNVNKPMSGVIFKSSSKGKLVKEFINHHLFFTDWGSSDGVVLFPIVVSIASLRSAAFLHHLYSTNLPLRLASQLTQAVPHMVSTLPLQTNVRILVKSDQ